MCREAGYTTQRAARQRAFIFIKKRSCPKSKGMMKKLRSYAFKKSPRAAAIVCAGIVMADT
jgi:hypothetical protein